MIELSISRIREKVGQWDKRVGWEKRRDGKLVGVKLPKSASPNHPVSRRLRTTFELKWIKMILGWPLAGTTLIGTLITPISVLGNTGEKNEIGFSQEYLNEVEENGVKIYTEEGWKLPVNKLDISQNYSPWHPAIDLRAEWGSPVTAISGGTISEINYWRWGYGNHLTIDHGNGIESLYAHLSKIEVEEGEELLGGDEIGKVGSTGWSSGAHLHLEIIENGSRLNPKGILGI